MTREHRLQGNNKTQSDEISGVINDIEGANSDFEYNKNKSESAEMMKEVSKDNSGMPEPTFGKTDYPADGHPEGDSEIEHRPEAKIFSKSHSFEAQTEVRGTDSGRTPKFGSTDDTASPKKGKRPSADEEFTDDMVSGLA